MEVLNKNTLKPSFSNNLDIVFNSNNFEHKAWYSNIADDFMQYAEGRMKKKVLGASEATALGVQKVVFADGRCENPIARALAGEGTVIS